MEDKWLNKLRDKVNDHDPQYEDDFWDAIEARIFPENNEKIVPVKKAPIIRLVTLAASVAACLLLFSVLFFLLKDNPSPSEKNSIASRNKTADKPSELQNESMSQDSQYPNDRQLLQATAPVSTGTPDIEENSSIGKESEEHFADKGTEPDQVNALSLGTSISNAKVPSVAIDDTVIRPDLTNTSPTQELVKAAEQNDEIITADKLIEDINIKRKILAKNKKPSIIKILGGSLLSAGIIPGAASVASGYASFNDTGFGSDPSSVDSPGSGYLDDIVVGNQNQQVSSTIRKNKALSVGISINTDISKKWSISSGVFYTKLSSTVNAGSDEYNYSTKQVVHYIGVPVQLNYRFINKPKFLLYVGAGGQADIALASKRTDKYEIAGEKFTENDPSYKPQSIRFSLAAAPGVEYRFNKNFGVYIEPGVRYFFPEKNEYGTNVEKNPVNFSLRTGLRYTINAKN
ncbi:MULTISPECIES: outer membrane beta-barrel protein [Chryseobacterium]|uniref:Outer membrane protein beta-barrel domain-containing protein n=1 Tax=Chryseobacterium camelliae TaxID=1265445 RepID=A0ABU0TDU2_9FLAO|nr:MULTISPECIES: outer membrane beta-barrel protein [Chryseobacterium]MDT3406968.1 hypothetical protein [Pseudacidovorax intermedius]MDQ1095239.1 hypothetical protein [Chryseobacterium camelliae]MDQ1099177.1 hypothetical protein [Chryseobacterium sp. SORGH_AS_1048]MDR6086526.1 hypothetical protein [Chryseobacterium sp. SORGH_AS_0909]MDR6130897.1 hypothetical protein [Chryseobacterium sp. SORGH_AS_1175]